MILTWNVRGAAKRHFARTIRDLVKIHHIQILVIFEPRINGDHAISVLQRLGFTNFFAVDASGHSGGIWLLWNAAVINLQVLECSHQTVTALISDATFRWLFTAVYASPSPNVRTDLWPYLDGLPLLTSIPWLLAGDFNEVVLDSEKQGGSLIRRKTGFSQWIDRNAIVDLGFVGTMFTWFKSPHNHVSVMERLDRALSSINWRHCFPEAVVRHLPKLHSDHCPLLIKLQVSDLPCNALKPFRFQAMWLMHDQFSNFLRDTWSVCNESLPRKLDQLKNQLMNWNRDIFGNLFQRKKKILRRLVGIHKALILRPNAFLKALEIQLLHEYNVIQDQEELFWLQKSRSSWLQNGDRNTRFFHLSTITRRRANKIDGLYNEAGVWVSTKQELQDVVVKYFVNLFTPPDVPSSYPFLNTRFSVAPSLIYESTNVSCTHEEIKDALFSIGDYKAPGYDGFPAVFYKKFWWLCKEEVCKLVLKCFNSAILPQGINHTLLTLVPKISNVQVMQHIRPISLCSTLYKIVAKIVVNKLSPYLSDLVTNSQSSFVPGRHITDNILVAQEVLHKFVRSAGAKGFLAWKIDLSKAYDRIKWSFIAKVLQEIGIQGKLFRLIMHCISTVTYQAIVNGELTAVFKPQCGLRQGDPMSPYLFVLCLEKLTHLINDRVQSLVWKPVQTSREGPKLSHILFADDIFLFAEASATQICILKECLQLFCDMSGQKVNYDKSRIYCSPNTPSHLAADIARISGSILVDNLGTYLGVPLIHGRVQSNTYQFVVDKVQNRLSAWKRHTLSLAGRLTYIKAVMVSVPVYTMQTVLLPRKITMQLDKLMRNFLWSSTAQQDHPHLVSWDTVTLPTQHGGLGIRSSSQMNLALLAKHGWRLLEQTNDLWSKVLTCKYLRNCTILQAPGYRYHRPSSTWRAILAGIKWLIPGLHWRVGDGNQIWFWLDEWTPFGVLKDYALPLFSKDHDVSTVKECLMHQDVQLILPQYIANYVKLRAAHINDFSKDRLIWRFNANGLFSVKSAYNMNYLHVAEPMWRRIWQLRCAPRLKTFCWLLFQGKLLTNVQRFRRGMTENGNCPLCQNGLETLDHVFRMCPLVTEVWNTQAIWAVFLQNFSLPWSEWLRANLCSSLTFLHGISWPVFFIGILWQIWQWS